jgi:hypothetical protein
MQSGEDSRRSKREGKIGTREAFIPTTPSMQRVRRYATEPNQRTRNINLDRCIRTNKYSLR